MIRFITDFIVGHQLIHPFLRGPRRYQNLPAVCNLKMMPLLLLCLNFSYPKFSFWSRIPRNLLIFKEVDLSIHIDDDESGYVLHKN